MSMITGCPACGTLFRVVPDQLRISDGWVRCGHCAEVFDATAHLQPAGSLPMVERIDMAEEPVSGASRPADTEPDALPAAKEELPAPAAPVPDVHTEVEDVEVIEVGNPYSEFPSSMGPPSVQPADEAAEASDFRAGLARPILPPQPGEELESEVPDSALDDSTNGSELEEISFVRQARRKAFWRRPLVRLVLALVVVALAGLLALQYAWRERDRLSVTQPELRPLLAILCEVLDCRIGPPRRIEAILIDNSGFTRLRQDTYRLSFTLRNQSGQPVAVPALQLTLTDTQDQPVLQRVLTPRELGATADTLAPAGDWSASVALAVAAGTRVAGYRLLAFYP